MRDAAGWKHSQNSHHPVTVPGRRRSGGGGLLMPAEFKKGKEELRRENIDSKFPLTP